MKIALYGNVCNNMFAIAKAVRANSDYDVHLYLPQNTDFHNLPENDDPTLKNNYPHWIHKHKDYNLGSIFIPWKRNIIKELNSYDIVILSSLAVSLAPYIKNPVKLFFVTGGDLTVLPFKEIHRTLLYNKSKINIKPILYQIVQRHGIKKIDHIITQPFYPFKKSIEKLKIPDEKILQSYFPIIFDINRFTFRDNAYNQLDKITQNEISKFKFRIFHPSRIIINNDKHLVDTGQWKQNDLLIRAFASFIQKNDIHDAGLYLINRQYKLDNEILELKKLIKRLKIDDFVIWLEPSNNKGFTRDDLVNIYSLSNVITDDYGAGWFGSICIEGFSCGKPVVSYVDEEAMIQIYPWHPFLSSNTIEGNANFFKKIYFDKDFAEEQGKKGRNWASEFHSQENAGIRYVKEIKKIFSLVKESTK
ncbi:hypothetical protein [Thiothrix sp.]|jgi:hypothetical protein|uniref:hypothetical protein n=1 Tax=Thiothrix sp. TaxID=1032 RepID=UPI00257E73C8|nr:hypothetical protein [Thiothrix sp.]